MKDDMRTWTANLPRLKRIMKYTGKQDALQDAPRVAKMLLHNASMRVYEGEDEITVMTDFVNIPNCVIYTIRAVNDEGGKS